MFEMRPYRRNSMSAWNPFSEMEEMERRLFNNDFFSVSFLAQCPIVGVTRKNRIYDNYKRQKLCCRLFFNHIKV